MKDIYERMALHTITRADGRLECYKIKAAKKSPISTEKDPDWMILVHARERNGKPFVCVDQNASIKEISEVLGLWLVPTLRKMNVNPAAYLHTLAKGLEDAE